MTDRIEGAGADHTVTAADTAAALGSGSVAVLGTPRLLAWLEAAAVAAASGELAAGETSVGTEISLRHRRPSTVGGTVRTRAVLTSRDDRRLEFRVSARSG